MSSTTAFPSSIAGVPTAVPAFIGYTARAASPFTLVAIENIAQYEQLFGSDAPSGQGRFNLYNALNLFYENGGANCYVVSTGDYSGAVRRQDLEQGLTAAGAKSGPTLLVVPDAMLLPNLADFAAIAVQMLMQAETLGDRFAILDVYGTGNITSGASLATSVKSFLGAVKTSLSYGAAYFPFLQTESGAVPPSGAMAGIYTAVDQSSGVWTAPAEVAIAGVTGPAFHANELQDGIVNPIGSLKAGDPPTVWSARTLDANSNDYRYIQIRRELIYIEQSIKVALQQFVFASNNAPTWVAVTSLIGSFLTSIWSEGGLAGLTASEAFNVQCGLGSTMSQQDILNGYMRVQVALAMIRPAEFIELTFEQQLAATG
jgi:phage tail sheath protein FI